MAVSCDAGMGITATVFSAVDFNPEAVAPGVGSTGILIGELSGAVMEMELSKDSPHSQRCSSYS